MSYFELREFFRCIEHQSIRISWGIFHHEPLWCIIVAWRPVGAIRRVNPVRPGREQPQR